MPVMSQIDYLAVGHFARDLTSSGAVTGGTVAYAGATASVLGCRTAILTSYAADFIPDIGHPDVMVECLPASQTTTFKNIYHNGSRKQYVHSRATLITPEHVPPGWETASIVHLAPIAGELDPALAAHFTNSLIGLTPQGWLRAWRDDGCVYPHYWEEAREILPLAAAVVLSEDDLADPDWLLQFRRWAPLLVLTQGPRGCTVYMADEERHIPAPEVPELDPTGAGDIFAAAFFVRLFQTRGNAWEAAQFANRIAAQTVEEPDLRSKILRLQQGVE